MTNSNSKYTSAFALLTSLFFMWGLLTVLVDSLVPRVKDIFELTYFQAGLAQFAFFGAFGLVCIPAGAFLNRIGYKKGIMVGLGIMGAGCLLFLPAASMRLFSLFLLGYFVLASGIAILQVAANPYVTVLGDPKNASSRLNLSQAFNSLGTTLAPHLGALFILSDHILKEDEIKALDEGARQAYFSLEASTIQMPFLILAGALLLLAGIVLMVGLPKVLNTAATSNYGKAFKNKKLSLGAIGIFLYVGAEVAVGTYAVNYFLEMNMVEAIQQNELMSWIASLYHSDLSTTEPKAILASFVTLYWGGAMLGRFIGSYLTNQFRPNKVLSVFAFLAIAFTATTMLTNGFLAFWSVLAIGFFNSIMFPTIFSIAIEDLGDLKPQGSGVLCTAIAGGAFIPPLFGFITDISSFKIAFTLILLCYGYIWFYGKLSSKKSPAPDSTSINPSQQ